MSDRPKRIYIAGPMTGMPEHNFPAFHAAAEKLRQAGWVPVNPAENFGGRTDLPREEYLRADVKLLAECEAVAMLPGWEESRGAKLEYLIAWELGMPVYEIGSMETMNAPVPAVNLHRLAVVRDEEVEGILQEAIRITGGARHQDYGPPTQDFTRTAMLWTAILVGRLADGQCITPMDVPLCMIAVKLARQVHRHKRDNLVDIAGYARTAAVVAGDE